MERVVWYGTVDYLRATCPEAVPAETLYALSRAYAAACDGFPLEEEKRDRRIFGFYGRSLGPAFLGYGNSYQMLQVSGKAAHCAAVGLGDWRYSVPRLDLAVTVGGFGPGDRIAAAAADAALRAREENPLCSKRKVIHIDGKGSGDTCYIGSRRSDSFGRIYDKWAQSQDSQWEGCWRWEVEFHNEKAEEAYKEICHSGFDARVIAGIVSGWFETRGVSVPLPVSVDPADLASHPRQKSSVDKSLDWLSSSVQPCVRRLLRTIDRDTILEALGLSQCS